MRAAAIDLGTVRVGRAIADELNLIAHPRPHLDGRNAGRLVEALAAWAKDEGITLFVLGLPKRLSGVEGTAARRVRVFAEQLRQRAGVPVELVDERWTTKEAHLRLRDQGLRQKEARSRVDSAAAALILQTWLDSQPRNAP